MGPVDIISHNIKSRPSDLNFLDGIDDPYEALHYDTLLGGTYPYKTNSCKRSRDVKRAGLANQVH